MDHIIWCTHLWFQLDPYFRLTSEWRQSGLYGRTFVYLSTRPHFYIFNGPSSESVHDVDGLSLSTVHLRLSSLDDLGQMIMVCRPNSSMRWIVGIRPAVHLRPSMENCLSSDFVHKMDGSSVRSSTCHKLSWFVVQIRPWDGRSEPKCSSVVHMDEWTVRRRQSSSVEAWRQWRWVSCRQRR